MNFDNWAAGLHDECDNCEDRGFCYEACPRIEKEKYMPNKLTPHFKRSEFECPDGCGLDTVDVQLMQALNGLRLHFNKPVNIHSGIRCKKHNKAINGSPNSQHLQGKAADISVKDITPEQVFRYLDATYPDTYGIGIYHWGCHIDVREDKKRWIGE